ncbi:MAG TPA: branched-chain amino acid ABC transporter permease [Thiomonas arsenitoxydans]|jgi:branched-chain amino acid transport system permease protein|nr:branched-chain amino acid ABC transporter permease [Thiomonas sp.]OZB75553.1 MAG: branched-chain amino acid ABC transporter permease [Thiomonas sp. 14-64-326]HOI66950.1 branched-chain amino acid ABC transporter permease [Thiomonas arsenitoxydans]
MNMLAHSRLYAGLLWSLLLLALIAPWIGLYPVLGMRMMCFALFACAFNLLAGYAGLISFGHAALFGGAGYLTGLALTTWGWPTPLGILTGVATALLIGLVMGLLAVRRSGIYFSMITLALAQIVYFYALQAHFTGGEDGLQGIPRGTLFGLPLQSDRVMYYLVLAVFVASWWFMRRVVNSPFGQVLQAVRENEPRAISLGYRVNRYKLGVFLISAGFAGLAGAMKAVVMGFETLTDVHWSTSGLVILMTLVGGLRTDLGPILGAVIITVLEEKMGTISRFLVHATGVDWFHQLNDSVSMVIGAIFVLCVLLFRRGIVGELQARWIAGK